MATHRVRFQVQQGSRQEVGKALYDEYSPCSKDQALRKLDELEADAKGFHRNWSWEQKLSSAISDAKAWVRRASRQDAQGGSRTVYNDTFYYDGYEYRVDIEINAGRDHFA